MRLCQRLQQHQLHHDPPLIKVKSPLLQEAVYDVFKVVMLPVISVFHPTTTFPTHQNKVFFKQPIKYFLFGSAMNQKGIGLVSLLNLEMIPA